MGPILKEALIKKAPQKMAKEASLSKVTDVKESGKIL